MDPRRPPPHHNRFGITLALLLGTCGCAFAAGERSVEAVLEDYVAQALLSNLALERQDLSVEQSLAALDEARGRYLPQASIESRFSRAEGGRTIPLPLGDLLNPAHATLNELLVAQGRAPVFGSVVNTEFEFLREQEQQTYVRLLQPLYVPEIRADVRARSALARSEEATRDTVARTLVRDVEVGYHNWLKTQQGLAIVMASRALLEENLRVNESLHTNGKVTRDQVLRAQAELLEVEQQQVQASSALDIARSYFNFLLNRPLETAIERGVVTSDNAALPALGTLQERALVQRPELRQLDSLGEAADAQVAAATSRFKPTIALAFESGVLGEEYRFGPDDDYSIASLTFSWNIFNGNQDRARLAQARLARRAVGVEREDTTQQIALAVEQAHADLRAALSALGTARARQDAAREAFKIAAKKRDAGVISQVEFLDGRTTLTNAELNYTVTQFNLLTRRAELEFAVGTAPAAAVTR